MERFGKIVDYKYLGNDKSVDLSCIIMDPSIKVILNGDESVLNLQYPEDVTKRSVWVQQAILRVIWVVGHVMTLSIYPDQPTEADQAEMKQFLSRFDQTIRCKRCHNNFKKFLRLNPLDDEVLQNRAGVGNWLIDLHNRCNKEVRCKRQFEYEEVQKLYQNDGTVDYERILREMFGLNLTEYFQERKTGELIDKVYDMVNVALKRYASITE